MLKKMISKNGLILAAFAIVCVGLITAVFFITEETIEAGKQRALNKTFNTLVNPKTYNNNIGQDCIILEKKSSQQMKQPLRAYRARYDGKPVAVIMQAIAPNGYSGKIALVVAIHANGQIAGVRVTEHSETPGLGDKIDISKSDWIKSFDQKSLHNTEPKDWNVKKDGGQFDAFTGATITPRAVIHEVKNTLTYFDKNKSAIFNSDSNCLLEQEKNHE